VNHPKNALLERCKQLGLVAPSFDTKSTGPAHERTFISDVLLAGEVIGAGQGPNRREAERRAAEEALAHLDRGPGEALAAPPRRKKKKGAAESEATAPAPTPTPVPFEGPWPIFEGVLAACLKIANSRVDPALIGEAALLSVQQLSLQLYKTTLSDLGEVMEIDEPLA
jgi:hypothetical protein